MTYPSTDAVALDVERLETCAFKAGEFTHAHHIAVAMWSLAQEPYPAALDRIRASLHHFLSHHSITSGYNETITVFWMRLLAHLMAEAPERPLHEQVNAVLDRYGSMAPIWAHYRGKTVFSDEAKAQWVEPDLIPLPI